MSIDSLDVIPDDWFVEHSGESRVVDYNRVAALILAAKKCHHEMRHTVSPRDSFTDALDALDAAIDVYHEPNSNPAAGQEANRIGKDLAKGD